MTTLRKVAHQALAALERVQPQVRGAIPIGDVEDAIAALRDALAQQEQAAGWRPISEPYEPRDVIDILMGDGSVLCAVLPQFDGDLWWEGSGTGEKFIDPERANVTHWRPHAEAALAQQEQAEPVGWLTSPRGVFRENPSWKLDAPQSVWWRIPLYVAPPATPAGIGDDK